MTPRPTPLQLRDDHVIETIDELTRRISDRFPESGLAKLCGQLSQVAQQAGQRSRWISRPIFWVRAIGYFTAATLIALIVTSIYFAFRTVDAGQLSVIDVVTGIEAVVNELIFLTIAIVFLVRWEVRLKRRRALAAIHELRVIAHIIDMHQLAKDPERYRPTWVATKNSPTKSLTAPQLSRYLDYCSEMLSLTGKIAAIYVSHFDDAESVAAVSEVENLTTSLSRKIWQKIVLLQQISGG